MKTYQWRMLFVRLICGMIGAILFYFVLKSGFVDGPILPDFSKLSGAEPDSSREFAKLLIWSFAAGFSERLVPDALDKVIAQKSSKRET